MQETKLCPFCKEEIKRDAIKCKHCGSMLSDASLLVSNDPTTTIRLALSAKYEILEEVGRGGMAVVYKAVQKNLDRIVALKALPPHFTHDQEFVERFHREARSGAQLRHDNIIMIHDEGVESGVHYMAMEFLEGIDLHKLIQQRGRISPEEAVKYIAPIADALEYAHGKGVIHRDVKSSNIIITTQDRSVLTDFGIAHATTGTQLTVSGTVLGTPEFMSPEQAAGKDIDGRSDVYSLGVVLYHALSGQFPHRGGSPLMTIYSVMHEPYIPLSDVATVPDWLLLTVHQCLEREQEKRIQSCQVLADLLRRNRAPGSQSARPLPRQTEPLKEQQPNIPKNRKEKLDSRGKRSPIARHAIPLLIVLIVLMAVALGCLLFQQGFLRKGVVKMPSLAGMSSDEAKKVLEQTGLRVGVITGPVGSGDRVINQDPQVGAEIALRTPVSLYVQKRLVKVPDILGLSPVQAAVVLRNADLVLGMSSSSAGREESRGKVIHQVPRAGSEVELGESVGVIVGE
jgi:serine/threonine protein kinase